MRITQPTTTVRPVRASRIAAAVAASLAVLIGRTLFPGVLDRNATAAPLPSGHRLVIGQPAAISVPAGKEVATLAGGCFWAMQAEFESLRGVDSVVAGYAGGTVVHPTYEQVTSETTGHAETVQIIFDPKVVSYADLMRIYFTDINPTTLDSQGPDSGESYRSVVFYHNTKQRDIAEQTIREITAQRLYPAPIVTAVEPYRNFYAAEGYHQDYFAHNPNQPYCAFVVAHEVSRFRDMNRARLKS